MTGSEAVSSSPPPAVSPEAPEQVLGRVRTQQPSGAAAGSSRCWSVFRSPSFSPARPLSRATPEPLTHSEQGHPRTPDPLSAAHPLHPIASTLPSAWSDFPSPPPALKPELLEGRLRAGYARRWLMGERRTWVGGIWLRQPCLALGGALWSPDIRAPPPLCSSWGGLEGGSGAHLLALRTEGRRAGPFPSRSASWDGAGSTKVSREA